MNETVNIYNARSMKEEKKKREEKGRKLRCTGVISDVLKMHRRVKRIGTALSSIKLSLNLYSFHRGAFARSLTT